MKHTLLIHDIKQHIAI